MFTIKTPQTFIYLFFTHAYKDVVKENKNDPNTSKIIHLSTGGEDIHPHQVRAADREDRDADGGGVRRVHCVRGKPRLP